MHFFVEADSCKSRKNLI